MTKTVLNFEFDILYLFGIWDLDFGFLLLVLVI